LKKKERKAFKGITKFRFNNEKAHAPQIYMEDAVDYLHDFIELNDINCDYEKSRYHIWAFSKLIGT